MPGVEIMAEKAVDRAIAQMAWLEGPSDTLQRWIHEAVQGQGATGQQLKDALHGRWLGHPLHPVLVTAPLGAWTAAMILDLAGMESGADISLGFGNAAAVGAMLAGMADWSETYGSDRRMGLVHALLNSGGLALNVASLVLRRTGARRGGVLLSSLAYGIGSLSAYLGGELVYSHGVGINHTAWDQPPTEFTPVMPVAELPEEQPVRGNAAGTPVVLIKRGERIMALDATCTHAGGPLDEGTLEGDLLICPWHGSAFCIADGSVRRSPATEPAISFETRVSGSMVEVRRAGE